MKVLLVALALLCLAEISFADKVQTIRTKTDSCALCGMSAGELSIKVCGNIDCCLAYRLDNADITFLPGSLDEFTGEANLKECHNYAVGDKDLGRLQLTLIHEGSDGLELEWVEIVTDERTVRCDVYAEVDSDEFRQLLCQN